MDLKSLLPSKKEEPREHFWALVIEDGWIQAGVWHVEESHAQVMSISPPIAWKTDDELIESCDTVLSAAVQSLPEDASEPVKTVFGVSGSWVSQGEIKPANLEKIKTLCNKLSLQPAGFVVLSEAIAHLFKSDEGSPLSAIVLGIGEENMELTVFRLGNLAGTTSIARSMSASDDIAEGLARFATGEPLPSRFVLYNGKESELEETRQSLIGANWEDYPQLNFLHVPKIEIVDPEKKILATALAGGSEIASVTSVSKALDMPVTPDQTTKKIKLEVEEYDNLQEVASPEELGFVTDQDIRLLEDNQPQPDIPPATPMVDTHAQSAPALPEYKDEDYALPHSQLKINQSGTDSAIKHPKMGLKGFFSKFPLKIPSKLPSTDAVATGKSIWFSGAGFLVISLLLGFGLWWYVPKATVTIYVSPQNLDEPISIFVDPQISTPDFSASSIPGNIVTEETAGDKTKATTGKKTVGERAKGKITLYRSGPEITLPSGTLITGPDNLQFTFDEAVEVPAGSIISRGTATVSVTASDIGTQYNLSNKQIFRISNYSLSEMGAENEEEFAGGTSREISAVSAQDQADLEKELETELLETVKQKITSGVDSDKYFIQESVSTQISNKSFSHKVGDESTTLSLSADMEAKALMVDKTTLLDFAREVLKDKIPAGYVLRDEQIGLSFDFKQEKDGRYELTALVKANLLPETKPDEIIKAISGKYPQSAKEYLTSIPGFTRAEINLSPQLPGRLAVLPRVQKNIEIEIAAEK